MSPSTNLAFLLTLSPVLLTLLLTLSLAPTSVEAASGHSRSARRHASFAARRAAGEFDVPSNHVQKRIVTRGKRADGTQCKVRNPVVVAAAVVSEPASSAWVEPAASSSSAVVVVSTSEYVAPTTEAWVAPTTEAWVAPTTTAQAWVAPTTTYAAAAVATTAAAVYVPPTNSNSGSCRKAGLAWPNGNGDQPDLWKATMGNSWYYTWSPWPVDSFSGLEFVPMLWGWKQVGDWNSNIDSYAGLGVTHALFANEPNGAGQANMPASSGCELWTQQFEQLRWKVPGIQLGSASPDGAPSGKQWLIDFEAQCPQNRADFITLHWYDVTYENFQAYVLGFAETFQRPLWVTEYACHNFNGGAQCDWNYVQNEFFEGTTAWMNGRSEVARYSAFGAMQDMQGVNTANSLFSGAGGVSSLGYKYGSSY